LDLSQVELPSNRKFGFFFSAVFLLAAFYSYYITSYLWLITFGTICIILLIITFINADLLTSLNKLWMKIGLLLGMVVSPLVMGLIFFGIFTPTGVLMRISGRDELRLRSSNKTSYWLKRDTASQSYSFKNQF
tara:strand:- start:394 stop:792 length:399 start_codon:yes stop_codon:yes gene_type:complete